MAAAATAAAAATYSLAIPGCPLLGTQISPTTPPPERWCGGTSHARMLTRRTDARMCTHAHAHACTRTHARTHTHTHARTHGNGGGGGHGGGSGSGGYGGRGGGSASQIITWHRATISQRGFPHVAQATVSIRGFPRVLFTGLLRPPAMPEDDGGRPSPPDIGEAHACV